ncbi:hypothetical protein [Nocardia sp. alder85J]|uniref:hypothetical protein n=1 Tax=Nocardia sp. alder85J TaxID=2862949 RepID=UPI001CD27285|nr:hypothetical protein [Nocardia sp. alder85J]MCX4098343.1 hypothetical protein [Nocardia sp. alder85J]
MNGHADFVVLYPDGTVGYGSNDRDGLVRETLHTHVTDLSTQGMGQVRAWFADGLSNPALHPNALAERVFARLGYHRPSGWYGPVAITMKENRDGEVAPLTPAVRAIVDELAVAAHSTDAWGTSSAHLLRNALPTSRGWRSAPEVDSAPVESVQPPAQTPDMGPDL